MGLSLSYGIIQDHDGSIHVESEPGQGAIFVIDLPIGAPDPGATAGPTRQDLAPLEPKRILVVDDEPDVAGVLVDVLRAEGHGVDTALNGAEALEKIERQVYDVILSDTKMPVLDGQGFFMELERRHPELHDTIGLDEIRWIDVLARGAERHERPANPRCVPRGGRTAGSGLTRLAFQAGERSASRAS